MQNLDIQIERWHTDRLIPSDVNPRTHSPEQVAQIAASIREFGFVNPILVGVDGGIIAGEGRLRAARTEGMHEVPVIVLEHLSEVQRRALVIADNQLALNAGWDEQMLREQLAALQDQDFNLDLLGFDDQELARQLAEHEAAAGLTDEDEVLGRAHSSGHPARRPLAVGPSQREPAAPGIVRRRNHPNRHHATVVRPATPVTYGD